MIQALLARYGIMLGLAVTIAFTGWLVLRQTEKLGQERAATAGLRQAVIGQVQQTQAALNEIAGRDALLTGVELERDALAKRKAKVVTKVQEVLVNAECAATALPEPVRVLVREYAAGSDDGGTASPAAGQPDDDGTGA